ncbi:aldehyde dehydrogenase family protein [Rhodococcus antarcticus]|jgi:acyl-CoA reductase-like NAD-dependent aldehyde dehydrogenase|uniref:Aldehyde dehydrogenase n=1 Tax=Rhodococcus antarcticus TaxID=2987751 RepID=A0ABY6P1T6_9NOCA|nr:aldehyde dehydrogenase family protein [Rhodococcus antarcticus]UZJ25615.1 aldehyde dehydrogenase family protein [Rhodococcus antarcticus]
MTQTIAPPVASTFDSLDPRTGTVLGSYPVHTADDVAAAVLRARRGAQHWAGLTAGERRSRLLSWRSVLARRADELAAVISSETGKPLDDARLEVTLVIDHVHWAARNAEKVLGRTAVSVGLMMANQRATVEHKPVGVVGVIGPWNYPAFTPMGSVVYALAAGNAVVLKPSELTPGVGRWLVESFATPSGSPDGAPVLQLVTGFGETGAALCTAGVDKVAFTGSTRTAKRVMAACAETLTPVVLECGGKDAMIVDADADLEAAADAAVWGGMSNSGQTCIGMERVYVVDAVHDRFVELVAAKARALRPGPTDRASYGPMTMASQVDVVRSHVQAALEGGGRAVVGGAESVRAPYVDPVVLLDVPEDNLAVTEETFGPVLVVNRVADADEAVERANGGTYGLGASVFAKARGDELAGRLRVGMVAVNSVISFAAIAEVPFGGVGDSGFGRIHGADGLREFTRTHSVVSQRFALPVKLMSFDRGPRMAGQLVRALRLTRGRRR